MKFFANFLWKFFVFDDLLGKEADGFELPSRAKPKSYFGGTMPIRMLETIDHGRRLITSEGECDLAGPLASSLPL